MLRVIILFTATFLVGHISAQNTISPRLENIMSENRGKIVHAVFRLSEQWNVDSVMHSHASQKLESSLQAKKTINAVREFTKKRQYAFLQSIDDLKSSGYKIQRVFPFWSANLVVVWGSESTIRTLANHPDVDYVYYDHTDYNLFPVKEEVAAESKGLATSGIRAIQVRPMWELGYTGRGRKALGVDTGVNTIHPSIAKRFVGDYFPMEESFFGYNNPVPVDISTSSHGTHTIGTVLGRTAANGDSIGVAYNAYYLVADPIVSRLSEVRRMSEILACFEWALNPDGNPETTNDIPDVITNSWGISNSGNAEDCDIPESLVFNVLEAAGVALVFSAGNSGPGAATIGQPAHIARSTTNIFSVGAVDAASSVLPIASFSSRGPTNCPAEAGTPLHIKPEVVAPGVNVYSAQGLDSYGSLSGTSMAAPHVAGAVLLLKEAFPAVTGTEILLALYETATDLGNSGEDNTFGRGMINVWLAYQYLSQSHTPATPASGGDVQISVFGAIEMSENDSMLLATVMLENNSNQPVNITGFDYLVNETYLIRDTSITVGVGEVANVSHLFSLSELPLATYYKIKVYARPEAGNDIDTINNHGWFSVTRPHSVGLPYMETFEEAGFDLRGAKVVIHNPDNAFTWRLDTVPQFGGSMQSASMKFRFYTQLQEKDRMDLFPILVGNPDDLKLGFKYAYAMKSIFAKDSLYILVSIDGVNFNDTVFRKAGDQLATVSTWYSSNLFVPNTPDKWRYANVDLSQFVEAEKIWIRFETVNRNGNDLFIDDVAVYQGNDPLVIPEQHSRSAQQPVLYPNPAKTTINVLFESPVTKSSVRIFDLTGREIPVAFEAVESNEIRVHLPRLTIGIYLVQITFDNHISIQRFVVE
jgi:bacillopeptidase F